MSRKSDSVPPFFWFTAESTRRDPGKWWLSWSATCHLLFPGEIHVSCWRSRNVWKGPSLLTYTLILWAYVISMNIYMYCGILRIIVFAHSLFYYIQYLIFFTKKPWIDYSSVLFGKVIEFLTKHLALTLSLVLLNTYKYKVNYN